MQGRSKVDKGLLDPASGCEEPGGHAPAPTHLGAQKPVCRRRSERPSTRTALGRAYVLGFALAICALVLQFTWEITGSSRFLLGSRRTNRQLLNTERQGGVKRIWAFSHNDEMQGDNALTLALSLGFGAIEVDTWLGSGPGEGSDGPSSNLTLLVGHEAQDIDQSRTLERVYLDPLMRILDAHNPEGVTGGKWVGLYGDDPQAEVVFAIDMKCDGEETWPHLVDALRPFLAKGYLTSYDPSTHAWTSGPLRIVGTGNTPLPYVYHQHPRYIFWDAPLTLVSDQFIIPATPAGPAVKITLDNSIAPMASAKFPLVWHAGAVLPPWSALNPVLQRMEAYAGAASKRGIEARWWGAAREPGPLRRRLWSMCRMTGAAWINADDLEDAADWLAHEA